MLKRELVPDVGPKTRERKPVQIMRSHIFSYSVPFSRRKPHKKKKNKIKRTQITHESNMCILRGFLFSYKNEKRNISFSYFWSLHFLLSMRACMGLIQTSPTSETMLITPNLLLLNGELSSHNLYPRRNTCQDILCANYAIYFLNRWKNCELLT